MPQHSISGRATIAGTNLRALVNLFAAAASGAVVRQIELTNTADVETCVALVRFSAATNVGAGLTEAAWDLNRTGPQCTGFAGHTGDATPGEEIKRATISAAKGAGVVWVFGGAGLIIPEGTANGIGVIVPNGTGQVLDYTIEWEE